MSVKYINKGRCGMLEKFKYSTLHYLYVTKRTTDTLIIIIQALKSGAFPTEFGAESHATRFTIDVLQLTSFVASVFSNVEDPGLVLLIRDSILAENWMPYHVKIGQKKTKLKNIFIKQFVPPVFGTDDGPQSTYCSNNVL